MHLLCLYHPLSFGVRACVCMCRNQSRVVLPHHLMAGTHRGAMKMKILPVYTV